MNTQRREEIRAMIAKPTWSVPILELHRAIVDAMDWIDQLEARAAERVIADAKAPAVVASDVRLALEHLLDAMDASFTGWGRGSRFRHIEELKAFARKALSESPTIPADRVLGDGVVAVDQGEMDRRTWRDFAAGWAGARRSTPRQSTDEECAVRDGLASAWIDALHGVDALRANQGGIAT